MKKYLSFTHALSLLLFFAACDDTQETVSIKDSVNSDEEGRVIIQQRDPRLPSATKKININEEPTTRNISGEIGNSDKFLGHAYRLKNGNYIMGDYFNVRNQIIDLDAIKNYDKTYVLGKQLLHNVTNSFAYSNFERYQYNSTVTKKVTSGFSINLGIFKIGKSKSTTEVFKSVIDNQKQSAYGELNIDFKNSEFILQASEASRKLFARQFLTKSFTRSLFNSSIASTMETYGDFVLTGYHTGAKAYAAYMGQTTDNVSTSGKEKDIVKKIDASIKKDSLSGKVEFGFTGGNHSSTTNTFKDENTYIYIKTLGGIRSPAEGLLKPTRFTELNIDLTSWYQSINDVSKHTMIDIADGGLHPISNFVLEKNFKQRFDDTFNGVLEEKVELIKPYVDIVRVFVRSTPQYESLYDVAAVLVTRQGDRIILSDGKAKTATDAQLRENLNDAVFMNKVNKIKEEKSKFFSPYIEISYNKKTRLNPIVRSPLCIELSGFNEKNFYRFYYEKTNTEYIYDPLTRLCFSYFADEGDDEVLDIYGIRDWVDSLPRRNISIASIANSYNIIGL